MKAQNNYTKPTSNTKLNKKDVLEALSNGAILTKKYEVYSYWFLTFPDGTNHYNIRKGANNGISPRLNKNIVEINRTKEGFSYKSIN